MLNLALAVVWGLIGVVLIAYHATTGDERWRIAFLGKISGGWAALFLCVLNLIRWWSYRARLAVQKAEMLARTRREHRAGPAPQYGEPNPDFMFGDEPPPKT